MHGVPEVGAHAVVAMKGLGEDADGCPAIFVADPRAGGALGGAGHLAHPAIVHEHEGVGDDGDPAALGLREPEALEASLQTALHRRAVQARRLDVRGRDPAVAVDDELHRHLALDVGAPGELPLVAIPDLVHVPLDHRVDQALVEGTQDHRVSADAAESARTLRTEGAAAHSVAADAAATPLGTQALQAISRAASPEARAPRSEATSTHLGALGPNEAPDATGHVSVQVTDAEGAESTTSVRHQLAYRHLDAIDE